MNQRVLSKERTRTALITAAHKLFSRDGFTKTGIRKIAKAAGYSTGAVFSLWSCKEDIWRDVMQMPTPDEIVAAMLKDKT